jgi:hypothetical protein
MLLRALVFAFAIAGPSLAAAQQAPDPVVGMDVRGEGGRVIGRVAAVERNAEGRIVAAEIPGLEPADAPDAGGELVASQEREGLARLNREIAAQRRERERARLTEIRIR